MARPVLYVLAGVNGAGKSSVGGHLLTQAGLAWFNPDSFARELMHATRCSQEEANAEAWQEGIRRLDHAIDTNANYAFETTLAGRTVAAKIQAATRTHDVIIWFCGLSSPVQHVRRVAARVKAGGHDIPESLIRERHPRALLNLIELMSSVSMLRVYDNSTEVEPGDDVPDPILVLEMVDGRLTHPAADDVIALEQTLEWAKPLVEAALRQSR
jgi:predicted ABC-type ATPase